jgi:hypothetical protein
MEQLDSDVKNPDERLHVIFFKKAMQNAFKTQSEGRPIYEDRDFVKIFVPGDTTSIIETYARDDHKARFPRHWAHYQNTQGGNLESGTPLSAWSILSLSQVEELRALKFFTIESIATASDAQLQRIGMIAGMAPAAFRERANRFLHAAKDESYLNQQAETAKKLQEENQEMKEKMARMEEMMADLAANQKKTPGRKPASADTEESDDADRAA